MNLDVNTHPYLLGLELADTSLVTDAPMNIDILIGSDHYFDVVTDDILRGENGPVAVNTKFGWVISGPTHSTKYDNSSFANLIITSKDAPSTDPVHQDDLTNELRRFWDTESIGIHDEPSTRDTGDKFLRDITYHTDEKRYEVNLPWKSGDLPGSNGVYGMRQSFTTAT